MFNNSKILSLLLCLVLSSVVTLNSVDSVKAADPIGNKIIGGVTDAGVKAGFQAEGDQPVAFSTAAIKLINLLLGFIGIIFFILLIYGGYLWMTARGNDEQVQKAKKIIREVIVALIIILMARLFTEFLITRLSEAALTPVEDG